MSGGGPGLRMGVVGATGALGGEVLSLLAESPLPVAELVPMASERSLGHEIEFRGVGYPVETELRLRGLDCVLLCAPPAVTLDGVRAALRHEVPCVDAAGALADSQEVALWMAGEEPLPERDAPLLVSPPAAALALSRVLRPLARQPGLRRVVATLVETASRGGRAGIEELYQESLALFNQQDAPTPEAFGRPVAFDCVPGPGAEQADQPSPYEAALARALGRLLPADVAPALATVQVPAFSGLGAALAVELAAPFDVKAAAERLGAAVGVELWQGDADGLTLRAVAGRSEVLVGRLRSDPSAEHGLALWLACDPLRLAAANAVELTVARLRLVH